MNIVSTIPASRYSDWKSCEAELLETDGEAGGYWLINTAALPTNTHVGDQCYMVFRGHIRGYFTIVDFALSEEYRAVHRIGKKRTTKCIVLATWRSIPPVPMTGFQNWRYTNLSPQST